jgi:dTDP-4-amino-4,6-dideoxygalactose transaminase
LAKLPLTLPWQHPDNKPSYHLYVIRLKLADIKMSQREVFEALRAAGIGVNLHYIPIYRQPYFERMGYERDDFPEAESYYSEAISLPIYPDLTKEQQDQVVAALEHVVFS